jgi:hypothetical protein
MRAVHAPEELKEAIQAAQREGLSSFGDSRLLVEKLLVKPRHVEVQVLADKHGNCVYLFDRFGDDVFHFLFGTINVVFADSRIPLGGLERIHCILTGFSNREVRTAVTSLADQNMAS